MLKRAQDNDKVDFVVNNAAGCGAMLKDYAHLLRDDAAYASSAEAFVKKNRDICEMLAELELPPPEQPLNRTVTYHDACHLAHAQRLTEPHAELHGAHLGSSGRAFGVIRETIFGRKSSAGVQVVPVAMFWG